MCFSLDVCFFSVCNVQCSCITDGQCAYWPPCVACQLHGILHFDHTSLATLYYTCVSRNACRLCAFRFVVCVFAVWPLVLGDCASFSDHFPLSWMYRWSSAITNLMARARVQRLIQLFSCIFSFINPCVFSMYIFLCTFNGQFVCIFNVCVLEYFRGAALVYFQCVRIYVFSMSSSCVFSMCAYFQWANLVYFQCVRSCVFSVSNSCVFSTSISCVFSMISSCVCRSLFAHSSATAHCPNSLFIGRGACLFFFLCLFRGRPEIRLGPLECFEANLFCFCWSFSQTRNMSESCGVLRQTDRG